MQQVVSDTQVVHLRDDALTEVAAIIHELAPQRVFFVVDEQAYVCSGARPILSPWLKSAELTVFCDFQPNPKLEDVHAGVDLFRSVDPDLVVALGGGTAIDLAKMIVTFASSQSDTRELAIGLAPITGRNVPLVVIPTTAGTGSEATHFAVVYVDGQKYSVADPCLLPDYVLIDPKLTYSLPASMTSSTGLDAFCQAIESIWAVQATDESFEYATAAVRLCLKHLLPAVHNPTSEARLGMCRASHLAGKAINISKTTLPHAMSYAVTSTYRIPHGQAVALTLTSALAFNAGITQSDCNDPRGVKHVRNRLHWIQQLFGTNSIEATCSEIRQFIAATGNAACLTDAGIHDPAELRQVAEQVNAVRLANNPRSATQVDLVRLLSE